MILAALAIIEDDIQRNELAEFYERYKNHFLNISIKYTHRKEDAEDAIEEAFLRIVQKPEKFFSLPENVRIIYATAILKNVAIGIYKKESRFIKEDILDSTIYKADENIVESDIIDRLNYSELLEIIDKLPPLQNTVLTLICLSELSIPETAQLLRISEYAVNQRLYLARKTIKKYIAERGNNNG